MGRDKTTERGSVHDDEQGAENRAVRRNTAQAHIRKTPLLCRLGLVL